MPDPPRLPEQPIFYPVLNEDYAIRIARDWNGPHSGVWYVTRFEANTEFLSWYPVQQAGRETILELRVPGGAPDELNTNRGLRRRVGTPRPVVRSPRWQPAGPRWRP